MKPVNVGAELPSDAEHPKTRFSTPKMLRKFSPRADLIPGMSKVMTNSQTFEPRPKDIYGYSFAVPLSRVLDGFD